MTIKPQGPLPEMRGISLSAPTENAYRLAIAFAIKAGRGPTMAELAAECGFTTSNAQRHVEALRASGLLSWDDPKVRGLTFAHYRFRLERITRKR